MSSLPKAALAILALPGVESLERESDGWVCHLAYGWTTEALSGGGTIIDTNLKTIRAYVVGAYQVADAEPVASPEPVAPVAPVAPMAPGPILPGEVRPPAPVKHEGPLPELPRFQFSAPLYAVQVWRGIADGWQQATYSPRDQVSAARLAHTMDRAVPHLRYRIATV